ncbi:hypothetical protein TNCV_3941131 [Trichonephila clavipes]|uniref:Uncharacterized protein n=1 Tax=Trichonephila clavipes TaxID=2585209 RepID=A0A8X7B9X9_TRICX|nr:hypothetical protein TNCV_3941131 [Trichonephila clavipes]
MLAFGQPRQRPRKPSSYDHGRSVVGSNLGAIIDTPCRERTDAREICRGSISSRWCAAVVKKGVTSSFLDRDSNWRGPSPVALVAFHQN